ncbi:hypothetical protein C345_06621 [Cryptococcus neoformans A2-102-5]|nr:hypothetical protein C346_06649 [Cryptococcus neoformans var. grubii D17-1]OXG90981.1 hypothetical protein C345_06621 [Cryptococcus neoformans var. grubii A2-102-5]
MSSDHPNESEPLLPLPNTSPTPSRLARRYITSPDARTAPLPFLSPGSSSGAGPRQKPSSGNVNGALDDNDDDDEEEEEEESESQGRRKLDKGKGRAIDPDTYPSSSDSKNRNLPGNPHPQFVGDRNRKRQITIIFSNTPRPNLALTITPTTSISQLKSLIRSSLPDELEGRNLRLIHSGRMLSDGVRIVPWVEAMEERVRRQAEGAVEGIVREVKGHRGGLEDGEEGGEGGQEMIWIHCIVGGKEEGIKAEVPEAAPAMPRRRGFDVLLDSGFSPDDVAHMRRQFYEGRGEEVPDEIDTGDLNDEHARALEEQWIEGDLSADTATTSAEGVYMSILHGLLVGFLFPLMGWFFIRESLPNFFDAEAEAQAELAGSGYAGTGSGGAQGEIGRDGPVGGGNSTGGASLRQGEQNRGQDRRDDQSNGRLQTASNSNLNPNIDPNINVNANANANDELGRQVSARVAANFAVGGMTVPTLIFGKRMQMGMLFGTLLNLAFGAISMLY